MGIPGMGRKTKRRGCKVKRANLIEAIQEAQRFLDRANEANKLYKSPYDDRLETNDSPGAAAAVRRSSMDLTKALSKLRRER